MDPHNPLEFFGAFNWLFDIAMPCLPARAFCILAVVYRQTWGRTDERSASERRMNVNGAYTAPGQKATRRGRPAPLFFPQLPVKGG